MPQAEAERGRIRQIGNSLGVIVPASMRRAGGFSNGDEVSIQCPRPGVITISCIEDTGTSKAHVWGELQDFISRHEKLDASWPQDRNFKEILHEARDEKILP